MASNRANQVDEEGTYNMTVDEIRLEMERLHDWKITNQRVHQILKRAREKIRLGLADAGYDSNYFADRAKKPSQIHDN